MKILIFLIIMAAVVSWMVWSMRKSQAEAVLAKRKNLQSLNKQRKEHIVPKDHATWPTVIGPASVLQATKLDSDSEQPDEDEAVKDLSMASIEYVPPEQLAG